tara:strand:- start:892 stop:1959 length:1068 start_codon:yes stop_codon:yes gene_type:complete
MVEKRDNKSLKYVFLYPDIAHPTIAEIDAGRVPKERLAGFYQLKERGWNVTISDSRWNGPFAGLRRKLKRYFHVPSISMIKDWIPADVIVIKDDFSMALTLLAKIMGKKVIYLDSMFLIPKSRIRNKLVSINLRLSNLIITFSETQADLWSHYYQVDRDKFKAMKYSMDQNFYSLGQRKHGNANMLISVGRDVGRDFPSLIESIKDKDVQLNLITLPYLLPDGTQKIKNINVKERLSYEELFKIYAKSSVAVIPLIKDVTYPSGIRAAMEAMLLGVPVVCTYTPVMEEYFINGEEIIYVEPNSPEALWKAINEVELNSAMREKIVNNARNKMLSNYTVNCYSNALESALLAFNNF